MTYDVNKKCRTADKQNSLPYKENSRNRVTGVAVLFSPIINDIDVMKTFINCDQ